MRMISDKEYARAKDEMLTIYAQYERGELDDDGLREAETVFRALQAEFIDQTDGRMMQKHFVRLCKLVAETKREFGAWKKEEVHKEIFGVDKDEMLALMDETRQEVYDLITQKMHEHWDRECLYYPCPDLWPEACALLPRALCNRTVRDRANDRNLRDIERGRPFRGFCALLSQARYE